MQLGSLGDRTKEFSALQNKYDKNLTTEEQFRKQRQKKLAGFPQTLKDKAWAWEMLWKPEGGSGSLAFYLLTDNALQSPSFQHPKWRKQTFWNKNKEGGAKSGAKVDETERHEM